MIYELDLPQPSSTILSLVKDYYVKLQLDHNKKQWLDQFNSNAVNSVYHNFASVPELQQLVNEEYSKYFKHKLFAGVGVMKNFSSKPGCLPPHIDRGRALAINYYIEMGGDSVTTCFYDIEVSTARNEAINFKYTQVNKNNEVIFEKNKWYAYDVCVAHSVENIQGSRYFLILGVLPSNNPSNYRLKDLLMDNTNNYGLKKIL